MTMNSSQGWRNSSPTDTLAGATARIGRLSIALDQAREDLVEGGLAGRHALDVAAHLFRRSNEAGRGACAVLDQEARPARRRLLDAADQRQARQALHGDP